MLRECRRKKQVLEPLQLTGETIAIAEKIALEELTEKILNDKSENASVTIPALDWSGSIINAYTYDAVSNRIKKETTVTGDVLGMENSVETGITTYTYNAVNQLIQAVNGETTIQYSYDANGNLLSEQGGSEDKSYTYDTNNRLLTVTISSGNDVTIESYTYDYEGNRISKQTGEEEKIYYLNDTFDELTQVALELYQKEDGTYGVGKYC